jgi:hypothetical protein
MQHVSFKVERAPMRELPAVKISFATATACAFHLPVQQEGPALPALGALGRSALMKMGLQQTETCSPLVVPTIALPSAPRFVARVPTPRAIATMRVCSPYQLSSVCACHCQSSYTTDVW